MAKSYKEWKKRHVNDSYEDYQNMIRKDAEGAAKDSIRKAYQPIYADIERRFGELPTRRTEREAYVGDIYGQNLTGIEEGREFEQGKIASRKVEQGRERDVALRDIAEDVRQSMAAGNRYLGVRGASDSSATGQMSYALQKAGMKEGSNIQQQYLSNIGGLDEAGAAIDFQAQQARNDLSSWKTDSLFQVSNWFNEQWNALETQKAGAQANEAQQLATLQMGILEQTLNQIAQVDQMNRENEQYIQNWEMERKGALEDYRAKLEIASQFDPNSLAYNKNIGGDILKSSATNKTVIPGGAISNTGGTGFISSGAPSWVSSLANRNWGGTRNAVTDYLANLVPY